MSISLNKNQTISLAKSSSTGSALTKVFMGLGWDPVKSKGLFGGIFGGGGESIDLDASVIAFDSNKNEIETVYFGRLSGFSGAIRHGGDNLTGDGDGDDERIYLDLSKLPQKVQSLVFTVNSFRGQTFDKVENASCRLVDEVTNKEVANLQLSSKGAHTGVVMVKLVRNGSEWELTALSALGEGRTLKDMLPQIRKLI